MEESQFIRLLGLFPMVRTRDYCADDAARSSTSLFPTVEPSADSSLTLQLVGDSAVRAIVQEETSSSNGCHQVPELHQAPADGSRKAAGAVSFWDLLKQHVESKLGQPAAQRFCEAFRAQHDNLVNKMLSLDSIERIAKNLDLTQK